MSTCVTPRSSNWRRHVARNQRTLGGFFSSSPRSSSPARSNHAPAYCLLIETRTAYYIADGVPTGYLVPVEQYYSLACHAEAAFSANAATALHYRLSNGWNKFKVALHEVASGTKQYHIVHQVAVPLDANILWRQIHHNKLSGVQTNRS
jgi:hypothetical protein